MKLKTIHLAAVALASLAGASQAAVVFSGTANSTGFTVDATTSLTIVSADLTYNSGENILPRIKICGNGMSRRDE
jgi:hypothetical protein